MPGVDVAIGIDATPAEAGAARVKRSFDDVSKSSQDLDAQQRQLNDDVSELENASRMAGGGLDEMAESAGRASEDMSELDESTRDFSGSAADARLGADRMAAVLALLAVVGLAVKDELGKIAEELRLLDPRIGGVTDKLLQMGDDIKSLILTGPLGGFRIWLREVRELMQGFALDLDEIDQAIARMEGFEDFTPRAVVPTRFGESEELFTPSDVREEQVRMEEQYQEALERSVRAHKEETREQERARRESELLTAQRQNEAEAVQRVVNRNIEGRQAIEEIREEERLLREGLARGDVLLGDYAAAMGNLRDRTEEAKAKLVDVVIPIERLIAALPAAHSGVGELAEAVGELAEEDRARQIEELWATVFPEEEQLRMIERFRKLLEELYAAGEITPERFEEAKDRLDEMVDSTDDWVKSLEDVADIIHLAFGDLDSDLADAARQLVRMIDTVTQLARKWDELSKAQQAAGVAGVAGQAVDLLGLGGEGEKPGAFGGSGGGDYADVGAAWGAVIGAVIGGLVGAFVDTALLGTSGGQATLAGIAVGSAIGAVVGEVIGGMINRGADEGLGQIQLVAGEIETKVLKSEGGLGKAIQGIGDAVIENIERITEVLQVSVDSLPTVDIKVRGENIVAKVGEYRKVFQEVDEAIEFLVTETLRAAEFSGGIDEALTQVLEAGRFGDLEGLGEQLNLIDQLITAEKLFVEGLSEMEVQLGGLPRKLALARTELENMGLSADQVIRLSGAAAVQAFSQARQAITGEQLTVQERQEIQRAQAELYNAQLELELARLEVQRSVLLAEAGLTEAEIKLLTEALDARAQGLQADVQITEHEVQIGRQRLIGREKFLQAEAGLYAAETELGARFLEGMVEVIKVGGNTLSAILESLPEEIRKQVEAITKIINALKNVGKIDIGSLRLPGIPDLGGIGGGGGGGAGAVDDRLAKFGEILDRLLQGIEAQTRLVEELGDELGGLETFLRELRTPGAGGATGLTAGDQVLRLRDALEDVAEEARGGDLDAIREFQRIAAQLRDVGADALGTSTAGFESLLRFIETLGGQVLTEGNRLLETELDHLADMRRNVADLLSANMGLHDLTREQIGEIRSGTQSVQDLDRNIARELARGHAINERGFRDMVAEVRRLGGAVADLAARR